MIIRLQIYFFRERNQNALFEQRLHKGRDIGHLYNLNALRLCVKVGVRAHENFLETQPGGLYGTPCGLGDGADFSAEANFAGKADIGLYGVVKIGGEHGAEGLRQDP